MIGEIVRFGSGRDMRHRHEPAGGHAETPTSTSRRMLPQVKLTPSPIPTFKPPAFAGAGVDGPHEAGHDDVGWLWVRWFVEARGCEARSSRSRCCATAGERCAPGHGGWGNGWRAAGEKDFAKSDGAQARLLDCRDKPGNDVLGRGRRAKRFLRWVGPPSPALRAFEARKGPPDLFVR